MRTIMNPVTSTQTSAQEKEKAFLPKELSYRRTAQKEGLAEGILTVIPAKTDGLRGYYLYWGDRKSQKLSDFTRIAALEAAGSDPYFYHFDPNLIVPEGAEKILVFPLIYNEDGSFREADCFAELSVDVNPFRPTSKKQYTFCVVTDTHVTADKNHFHNAHMANCFAEIIRRAPDAAGIMSTGDVTNHGYPDEWEQFRALWTEAQEKGLPPMLFAPGNHDMHFYKYNNELGYQTSFAQQKALFLQYTHTSGEELYHAETVAGHRFLFLGPERPINPGENECYLHITEKQFAWLEEQLDASDRAGEPAFLFLHQPMCETVSGSLSSVNPGIQSWHGVYEDARLRALTDRYPRLVMFTGHTHWKFDSLQPILPGNEKTASYVNAASVAYLWTDKNGNIEAARGEDPFGSEGYFVDVYPDGIVLRGYDYASQKWSATAQFLLELP